MKVRIQHNSIRFRLKEFEVADFQKHGCVTEILKLGTEASAQIQFVLQVTTDKKVTAHFAANTITIGVPEHTAAVWSATDLVGFDDAVETGNGNTLKILVEKDFKCLNGSESENNGSYPNPMEHC